jgi:hypothetical protein
MAEQQTPPPETNPGEGPNGGFAGGALLARALSAFGITDRASFDSVTGPPREIAGLYAYAQLDCLVELAYHVAKDFFARPDLYTELDDPELPKALAQLATRTGSDELFPSREQREAMFMPVFGSGDAADDLYVRYRDSLLDAAATLAEWGQPTGIPMLRNAIRTAHLDFRAHLLERIGSSVSWSRGQALPAIADGVAYPILRSKSIVGVFGLTKSAVEAWPYVVDADGDQAVVEISKQLRGKGAPDVTQRGFLATQRVALRGAEALAAILDYVESDDDAVDDAAVDALSNRCYTWYTALRARKSPVGAAMMRNGGPAPQPVSESAYGASYGR